MLAFYGIYGICKQVKKHGYNNDNRCRRNVKGIGNKKPQDAYYTA
jgi:hypothetical protein